MRRTGASGVLTLMSGTRRLTSSVTVVGPVACCAFLRDSFRAARCAFIRRPLLPIMPEPNRWCRTRSPVSIADRVLAGLFGVALRDVNPQQPAFEIRVRAAKYEPDMFYVRRHVSADCSDTTRLQYRPEDHH